MITSEFVNYLYGSEYTHGQVGVFTEHLYNWEQLFDWTDAEDKIRLVRSSTTVCAVLLCKTFGKTLKYRETVMKAMIAYSEKIK